MSEFLTYLLAILKSGIEHVRKIPSDRKESFTAIVTLITVLFLGIRFITKNQRLKSTYRNLTFFSEEKIKSYTKNYINHKFSSTPAPSLEDGTKTSNKISLKKFKKEILGQTNDDKFYIILAESGMGKTALFINLLYRHYSIWNVFKGETFKLFIINEDIIKSIEKYKEDNNAFYKTILLLDALDEDTLARADFQKRIDDISKVTSDFKRVILTSRVQFFPSEKEEPKHLNIKKYGDGGGFYRFKKLHIVPFSNTDIKRYLRKKYRFLNPFKFLKRKLAYKAVHMTPKIMSRPMILNFIDDVISDINYTLSDYLKDLIKPFVLRIDRIKHKNSVNMPIYFHHLIDLCKISICSLNDLIKPLILNIDRCDAVTPNDFYQYSSEVYEKIISEWISREANHRYNDDSKKVEYSRELWSFSVASALFIYESSKDKGSAFITKEDIHKLFKELKTDKSTFTDLSFNNIDEFALTERSLLTRDKEGNWSFSHKSIYEYFLAYLIYNNFEYLFPKMDFNSIDMCEHFLEEFCLKYSTIPFFTGLKNKNACMSNSRLALTPQEVDIPNLNIWLLQDIEYEYDHNSRQQIFYLNQGEVYDYRVFLPLKKLRYSFLCELADAYSKKKSPLVTKLFERAINKDPNGFNAYQGLYEYYNDLEKYELALENLLLAKQKCNIGYGSKLGRLYFDMGDKAKALPSIKEYYEKEVSISEHHHYQSYVYDLIYLSEFKVALEKALEAYNKFNDKNSAYLVGYVYERNSDFENALKYYKLSLEFDNKRLFIYKNIGDCYLALNEKNKAIESYRQPTVIEPNDVACWHWLGDFYYKLKMKDNALECYIKPTTFEKADSNTWRKLAEFYVNLGEQDLALEACIQSAKCNNLSYDDWCELGDLYRMKLENNTKAQECYEKSIALWPNFDKAWNGLGNVYFNIENNEQARDCYLKAIEYTQKKALYVSVFYSNLANSYLGTKDYTMAYGAAKKALTLNKNNANAYNILGLIFSGQDSIDYFVKAHSISPDDVTCCYNASVGYCDINKFSEALDFCNKALKIDPHHKSAQKLLKKIQEEIAKKDSEVVQPPNSKTEP